MKQILLLLLLFTSILGSESFGIVAKIQGSAFQKINGEEISLEKGKSVSVGGFIYTGNKSKVVIKFNQDVIILNQNSKLMLDKKDFVSEQEGSIFYKISPLISVSKAIRKTFKDKFTIRIRTSTIGIRGTNFLVETNDKDEKILLRDGKLNIASVKDEYQICIKKEKSEFEAYKRNMEKDFKEFVDAQEYEFCEYKKEFELEQNKFVYIKDGKVYQEEFSRENIQMFSEYDMFMGDI